MVSSEKLFFEYANSCSDVLLQKGAISIKRHEELMQMVEEGKVPERNVLEETFPAAIRRIKRLAQRMGIRDYWDIRVIKEYWHNEHNKIIDKRDGNYANFPEVFCEYCKTYEAEVVEKLPDGFVLVEFMNIKRPVKANKSIGNLKIGDKVIIHQSSAVEIIH